VPWGTEARQSPPPPRRGHRNRLGTGRLSAQPPGRHDPRTSSGLGGARPTRADGIGEYGGQREPPSHSAPDELPERCPATAIRDCCPDKYCWTVAGDLRFPCSAQRSLASRQLLPGPGGHQRRPARRPAEQRRCSCGACESLKHSAPCPDNNRYEPSGLRRAHGLVGAGARACSVSPLPAASSSTSGSTSTTPRSTRRSAESAAVTCWWSAAWR
jgi:hypothetical protein